MRGSDPCKNIVLLSCLIASLSRSIPAQVSEKNEEQIEDSTEEVTTLSIPVSSTLKPQKVETNTTGDPLHKTPCICTEGTCKCCTGAILNRFNYTQRNKACVNVNYNPDDFEFHYKLMFNERVLLQNKISGKNPRPACIPVISRFFPGNMCLKFSNVYLVGRNFHACLELRGVWNERELFGVAFDCFRIGANGIAIVKPEDGGGLPTQVVDEELSPAEEDYDDSAKRNNRNTKKQESAKDQENRNVQTTVSPVVFMLEFVFVVVMLLEMHYNVHNCLEIGFSF